MKKLFTRFSLALAALALAATAWGAGPCTGKVTKVDGENVTLTLSGAVPPWAKQGANVSAKGGSPKVVSVKGNEVTLKFSKAKAEQIKVDSTLTLSPADEELQGC